LEIAKTGDDAADATVVSAAGYGLTSAGLPRIDGALGRTMSRRLRGPIDP
jgi:hypothetical protein